MVKKVFLGLVVVAILVTALAIWVPPVSVSAGKRAAPTPTITPTPIPPARVGSNAHLAIGALVLVGIILFGVILNVWRKKEPRH